MSNEISIPYYQEIKQIMFEIGEIRGEGARKTVERHILHFGNNSNPNDQQRDEKIKNALALDVVKGTLVLTDWYFKPGVGTTWDYSFAYRDLNGEWIRFNDDKEVIELAIDAVAKIHKHYPNTPDSGDPFGRGALQSHLNLGLSTFVALERLGYPPNNFVRDFKPGFSGELPLVSLRYANRR